MKILKQPNDFKKIITCERIEDKHGYGWGAKENFCGAVLEIDGDDIYSREWSKYCEHGIDYGVVCPVCGSFIVVEDIPTYVKKYATPFSRTL